MGNDNNSLSIQKHLNRKLTKGQITFGEKEKTDLDNSCLKYQGVLIDKNYFKHML